MSGAPSELIRNNVSFDTVRFIRNSHNNNNSINMCREFNVG